MTSALNLDQRLPMGWPGSVSTAAIGHSLARALGYAPARSINADDIRHGFHAAFLVQATIWRAASTRTNGNVWRVAEITGEHHGFTYTALFDVAQGDGWIWSALVRDAAGNYLDDPGGALQIGRVDADIAEKYVRLRVHKAIEKRLSDR